MSSLTYAKYMTKNHNAPIPGWLFNVTFRIDYNQVLEDKLNELECININLPEMETATTEVNFLGTSMTVPTKRKFAGELTAEFFDKKGRDDSLLTMITNNAKESTTPFDKRNEFKYRINKIEIDVYPMNVLSKKISDTDTKIFRNIYKRYTLYNPVITKFNYSSNLDTSSEDALKYSVSIHYDYWTIKNTIKVEEPA